MGLPRRKDDFSKQNCGFPLWPNRGAAEPSNGPWSRSVHGRWTRPKHMAQPLRVHQIRCTSRKVQPIDRTWCELRHHKSTAVTTSSIVPNAYVSDHIRSHGYPTAGAHRSRRLLAWVQGRESATSSSGPLGYDGGRQRGPATATRSTCSPRSSACLRRAAAQKQRSPGTLDERSRPLPRCQRHLGREGRDFVTAPVAIFEILSPNPVH